MKKSLVLMIAPIMIMCLVASCGGEEKSDTGTKIGIEPVETISTSVNDEFILTREFDLNSGYIWRENYDESMLELAESAIETETREDTKIILNQVFRFKALKRGKTEITLVHRRATLDEPVIAKQEVISVNIK